MKTIKKINHVVALGMIAATLMFTVSCKKTNPSVPAGLPSLTTTGISAIVNDSAKSGGTIITDSGAAVTARGVCWGTSVNPTISSDTTKDGTGTGTFTSILTGLTAATIYYVRAYATNSVGTAYGAQVSFTTSAAIQQAVVNLGVAGDFVILSKSGITDISPSVITGDIGTSPISGASITGLTCPEVTGTIYTVDAAGPACRVIDATKLTTAVLNMETAYTTAAGRINPDFLNLGTGNIGGLTLAPGLYKWTSAVTIPTDVTISGGPDDVWIFQVAGTLTMSSAMKITLSGGAQAKNIYWATAGAVTLGTTSHFEGIILAATNIAMQTGATMNGKLLAQTAVTLDKNTVTKP
jgi:Ice-binding-like